MTPFEQMIVAVLSSGAVTGAVIKLIEYLIHRHDKKKQRGIAKMESDVTAIKVSIDKLIGEIKELQETDIVLLHDRIYQVFYHLDQQSDIDVEDSANLDYLHDRYAALGGNHRAEIMYQQIKEKPIRYRKENNNE